MAILPSELGLLKYTSNLTATPSTTFAAVHTITPPNISCEAIDTTVLNGSGGAMTQRASKFYEVGEMKFGIYYDPSVASHDVVTDGIVAGTELRWGITFDGVTIAQTFNGFVSEFAQTELQKGSNVGADITIKPTGGITLA